MSKSKQVNLFHSEALKYEPATLTPTPCSLEELETHLRAFITAFIIPSAQSRWLELVVEKRPLWFSVTPRRNIKLYRKINALLNGGPNLEQYIHPIKGSDSFPVSLDRIYGAAQGVYFDVETAPCKMTAAEAATKATENRVDAIFSFTPGRKAIFFHHEGSAWLCER